jgi:hypothetical protein
MTRKHGGLAMPIACRTIGRSRAPNTIIPSVNHIARPLRPGAVVNVTPTSRSGTPRGMMRRVSAPATDRHAATSVSQTNFGGRGNATTMTPAILTVRRLGVRATIGLRISNAASGGAASNRAKSNPAKSNPAKSNPAKSNPAKRNRAKSNPAMSNGAMSNAANGNGTRTNGVRRFVMMIGGTIASAMSLATTASRMNNCA